MSEHEHDTTTVVLEEGDANRDPITGEPGSHPVGTGVGAAGGGVAGATVGAAVGGPVGAAVGGAVGAIAGGLAGHAVAEQIDPTVEEAYWKETYRSRPYVDSEETWDDYSGAYRTGWKARAERDDVDGWDSVENEIEEEWNEFKGESRLQWDKAKIAARDAWNRVENYFDPEVEDRYWRHNYTDRPYVAAGEPYATYEPAYRFGRQAKQRYRDNRFEQVEDKLEREWAEFKADTRLNWEQAKDAVRDAWHRVERALPGDFDGDGR
ncbi:MAG TPA: glycine zipper family protein [Thermoanaerobaculia bacterium]|nr:glycine zipper family protein [Thermoanaerobaculia bacterium]